MSWPSRAYGAVAGVACVHDVPSHSHVSPSNTGGLPATACMPPKSTIRWRCASYVMTDCVRGDGDGAPAAGVTLAHVGPSHSHVSLRKPPPAPPNSTTRWLKLSYAMAWPNLADGEVAGAAWVHVVPFQSHVSA